MEPRTLALMARLLRNIAVELRIANDLAQNAAFYYSTAFTRPVLDEKREAYREEMV